MSSVFNPDVTYQAIDEYIRPFANEMYKEFRPDVIIAVGRGGLILSSMLAHQLEINRIRHLDIARDREGEVFMRTPFITEENCDRILVVDDIACKGQTLKWIQDNKLTLFPSSGDSYPIVRYLTLFHRNTSSFEPDYALVKIDHDNYVTFPWDYDYSRDDEEEIPF